MQTVNAEVALTVSLGGRPPCGRELGTLLPSADFHSSEVSVAPKGPQSFLGAFLVTSF